MDDTYTSQTLFKKLLNNTRSAHSHSVVTPMTISRSANPSNIFEVLSEVVKFSSRVLLVHCDGDLVNRIFEQAQHLNMNTGEWIWILVGDAVGEDGDHYLQYPLGVMGVRLRPLVKTKHVVRMSVRLVAKALRDSTSLREVSEHQKSSNGPASCWYPPSPTLKRQTEALLRSVKLICYVC